MLLVVLEVGKGVEIVETVDGVEPVSLLIDSVGDTDTEAKPNPKPNLELIYELELVDALSE